MIVTLPFPAPELFPNVSKGKHWSGASAIRKRARESGYVLTNLAIVLERAAGGAIPTTGNIPLSIVFSQPDGRHRDLDNCLAAMKPAIDGIAQAMGVNDRQFRPLLVDSEPGTKPGAVIVAIGVQIISGVQIT